MLSDYKDLFKYLYYLYIQCIYTKKQLHHALEYVSANELIFISVTERMTLKLYYMYHERQN